MTRAALLPPFVVLGLILLSFGCASGGASRPATRNETAPEPVQPEPPPPPSVEASPADVDVPAEPEPEEAGAYGPKTVVIGSPEPEAEAAPTLAEAAQLARERRAREGAPIAVITDKTLPEYATGELSEASVKPGLEKAAPTDEPAAEAVAEERGEEYWRSRVRDARIDWRDLVEELARLEQEANDLRRRFYAEDDGFYRDSQIKPAWDRTLDRLSEVRDRLAFASENVQEILQEGRLAGALPGWLREGIEYEPKAEEAEEGPGIHEPSEPQVIDETGNQDDGR